MKKQYTPQFSKRILLSALVLIVIYIIGFTGYMIIEDMTLLDAIFMTTITITTVGYGVIKELSQEGTIFTIILIIIGTGAAAYIIINLADFLLSEFLLGRLHRRRMAKMISKLKKHYIICGLGRVGNNIALELQKDNSGFIVIDNADEPIEICKSNNWAFIQGDASTDEILLEAGIKRAKAIFATLHTDPENVYITLSSKALNRNIFVVARAKALETISRLEMAGADRVVSPQIIGGKRMVALAKQPTVIDFLDTLLSTEDIEISLAEIEIEPGSKIDGITIKEANQLYQFEAMIVSIIEKSHKVMVNKASANTLIKAGHKLIVVGAIEQIQKLSELAVS
ncbi:potassium channel family protein [Actinomycetota bacterium]